MSDIFPQLGVKRTSDQSAQNDVNDPEAMYAARRGLLVGFFGSLAAMVANWSGGKALFHPSYSCVPLDRRYS